MNELRKDYILNRWVIIAEKRGKRPHQFKDEKPIEKVANCFFCPGHEETTPAEIGRVEKDGKWIVRWFPNKFPAVQPIGDIKLSKKKFFSYTNPYGTHEVIAETPDHSKQADLNSIKL